MERLYDGGERLARELRRLLAHGRFGPLVLWLRNGERVTVRRRSNIRVSLTRGTISVMQRRQRREILHEDLLAIEMQPRPAASTGRTH